MSAIDENWERWIWASVIKWMTDHITAHNPTWYVFVEGTERDTGDKAVFIELRLDGPQYKLRQGNTRVYVEVDTLISVQLNNKKLYTQNQLAGAVASIMDNYIPVYKLGNLAGDDGTVSIGCLRIDDTVGIDTHKFGQIGPKARILQGIVTTKYWIDLQ